MDCIYGSVGKKKKKKINGVLVMWRKRSAFVFLLSFRAMEGKFGD